MCENAYAFDSQWELTFLHLTPLLALSRKYTYQWIQSHPPHYYLSLANPLCTISNGYVGFPSAEIPHVKNNPPMDLSGLRLTLGFAGWTSNCFIFPEDDWLFSAALGRSIWVCGLTVPCMSSPGYLTCLPVHGATRLSSWMFFLLFCFCFLGEYHLMLLNDVYVWAVHLLAPCMSIPG